MSSGLPRLTPRSVGRMIRLRRCSADDIIRAREFMKKNQGVAGDVSRKKASDDDLISNNDTGAENGRLLSDRQNAGPPDTGAGAGARRLRDGLDRRAGAPPRI